MARQWSGLHPAHRGRCGSTPEPGGWLLFEHGYDQGEASRNLLAAAGFKAAFTHPDLAGIDRVSGAHL
jgi:release factor glutamine methyltransferase